MKNLLTLIAIAVFLPAMAEAQNCTRLPCDADYIWPETAREYVDPYQASNLPSGLLRLARNEIFARHGRMFVSEDLQAFFGARDWYRPVPGEPQLSEVEAANVRLFQAIERGMSTEGRPFSEVISRNVAGYSAIRDLTVDYREGFGREDYQETQPIRASGAAVRLDDAQGRPDTVINLLDESLGDDADGIYVSAFAMEWDESLLVILSGYLQAQPEWLGDDLLAETNARIVSSRAGRHGNEAVTVYEVAGQGAPVWIADEYTDDDCFENDPELYAWSHIRHGSRAYPVPALRGTFSITEDGIILRADYLVCAPHHEGGTEYYTGYRIRYELRDFVRGAIPDTDFKPPFSQVNEWVAPG